MMNKKTIAIALGLLVALGVGATGGTYLVRWSAFNQLQETPGSKTLLSRDRTYNAFPKAVRVTSGNAETQGDILAVWYSGNAHVDPDSDGIIVGARSTDDGQSWSAPAVIYDDPTLDCRNIGLVCAPNGTLVLFFAKMDARTYRDDKYNSWKDFGIIKSYDGGRTWTAFESLLDNPGLVVRGIETGNGYGDAVVVGGDLYIACYGFGPRTTNLTHMSFFLKSPDNGETWSVISAFEESMTDVSTGETDFVYSQPEDLLFGFTRTQTEDPRHLYYFESHDRGTTWTNFTRTNIRGDCPDILRLQDGRYACFIRGFTGDFRYLGYFLLPADFPSNPNRVALAQQLEVTCFEKGWMDTHYGNIAYSSAVPLPENSLLVVYYSIDEGGVFAKIVAESDL
jgi:hypothetical protein